VRLRASRGFSGLSGPVCEFREATRTHLNSHRGPGVTAQGTKAQGPSEPETPGPNLQCQSNRTDRHLYTVTMKTSESGGDPPRSSVLFFF
jgi:hypothetical protein